MTFDLRRECCAFKKFPCLTRTEVDMHLYVIVFLFILVTAVTWSGSLGGFGLSNITEVGWVASGRPPTPTKTSPSPV